MLHRRTIAFISRRNNGQIRTVEFMDSIVILCNGALTIILQSRKELLCKALRMSETPRLYFALLLLVNKREAAGVCSISSSEYLVMPLTVWKRFVLSVRQQGRVMLNSGNKSSYLFCSLNKVFTTNGSLLWKIFSVNFCEGLILKLSSNVLFQKDM